jgi:hypothetical protein
VHSVPADRALLAAAVPATPGSSSSPARRCPATSRSPPSSATPTNPPKAQ